MKRGGRGIFRVGAALEKRRAFGPRREGEKMEKAEKEQLPETIGPQDTTPAVPDHLLELH